MITILDYQAGNLKSLQNALTRQGFESLISSDPQVILVSQLVILPGVGAYEDAACALENRGLKEALTQRSKLGRPILGICLGMQLLYEDSDETEGEDLSKGLGLFKGKIRRLLPSDPNLKIPHMGWNQLQKTRNTLPQLKPYNDEDMYFVHSYGLVEMEDAQVQFYTDHGQKIPAMVYKPALPSEGSAFSLVSEISGALMGFQFHPEKSGPRGEKLLAEGIQILLRKDAD